MEQHDINLTLAIKNAVAESIENMVFMSIETDVENVPADMGPDVYVASIRVMEPRQGELRLTMPQVTASEIAKTLYSTTEGSISEDIVKDVLCELLNTIAGRVMKRLLPAECTFRLGLPEILDTSRASPVTPFIQCSFMADGNLLAIAAWI